MVVPVRGLLTTVAEVVGMGLVAVAAGMTDARLGVAVAGAMCVGVGYLAGRQP